MANTYIARGVTLTEATLAGPGPVLLVNGRGTFTVDGTHHRLELTAGQFRRPLRDGEAVNATGIATAKPPRIGSFRIQETMSVKHADLPVVADGPIFLFAGAQPVAAAAAQ